VRPGNIYQKDCKIYLVCINRTQDIWGLLLGIIGYGKLLLRGQVLSSAKGGDSSPIDLANEECKNWEETSQNKLPLSCRLPNSGGFFACPILRRSWLSSGWRTRQMEKALKVHESGYKHNDIPSGAILDRGTARCTCAILVVSRGWRT
jgi:hypothetical protein